MARLLSIPEAARALGVPEASLRSAAERYGFIVRMGRSVRVDSQQFDQLVRKCQDAPRAPASTGESHAMTGAGSGSSATPEPKLQPAQQIADMLKKPSRPTSPGKPGGVVALRKR